MGGGGVTHPWGAEFLEVPKRHSLKLSITRLRLETSNPDHGRGASGFLHFRNIDATAVVQGPEMQQTNRGNNGRTMSAVQSTKQAAKAPKPNFSPIF